MVFQYPILGPSAIERSLLREDVNQVLRKVSTVMCPLHIGFFYVWPSFHSFRGKVSVIQRCPLYRMSTIRRFHCITQWNYETLIDCVNIGSFIYDVQKVGRGGRWVAKFWAISQLVVDGFWRGEYFSDPVDAHIYKKKTSFFHRMSSFFTNFKLLLHWFHPETYFWVNF